jgi:hypothetical protein
MIQTIDLSSVLRHSVCELYSNLVTRPTGVAVRTEIELLVSERAGVTLTVIDFTHVGLLDYSCADEVVAKLLLRATNGFFICRGLHEAHIDAIETALSRYELALVVEAADGARWLLGAIEQDLRRAWEAVVKLGRAGADEVAGALAVDATRAGGLLETLADRRVVMRAGPHYQRLPSTDSAPSGHWLPGEAASGGVP